MTRNQILDVFGIRMSGENRILKDDEEILEVVDAAYHLAIEYENIYNEGEDYEDDI